VSTQQILRT
jgi:hypothetical protein